MRDPAAGAKANNLEPGLALTKRLILHSARSMLTAVQPIVELESSELVGHELLSRPKAGGRVETVVQLLSAADAHGQAPRLSRRLRCDGLAKIARRIEPNRLFLNTHPAELAEPKDLLESLNDLLELYPGFELTVEIHQDACLELETYLEHREGLRRLGMGVAFDDFGEGYSRLLALATAPPDYVKFAPRMVRDIDQHYRFRSKVLQPMVAFVRSLGSVAIAVGVESKAELEACQDIGFQWVQGFFVGRPWTVAG